MEKATKKKIRAADAAIWILLLFTVAVLGTWLFTSHFLDWRYGVVGSGSMEPALKTGGMVISSPVKAEDVRVGDVITFTDGRNRITHRVTKVDHDTNGLLYFQTKGDANEAEDPERMYNLEGLQRIRMHIPWLGYLVTKFRLPILFVLGVLICARILAWAWFSEGENRQEMKPVQSVQQAEKALVLSKEKVSPDKAQAIRIALQEMKAKKESRSRSCPSVQARPKSCSVSPVKAYAVKTDKAVSARNCSRLEELLGREKEKQEMLRRCEQISRMSDSQIREMLRSRRS